jgi:hypothetical protein
LLDRLWAVRGASAVCRYPATRIGSFDEAVRRHPSGWRQHVLHVHHRGRGGWEVHGEVDASNDELFATLLRAAAAQAATPDTRHARDQPDAERASGPVLVLDCAGLTFTGVAAWRAAAAGTATFRAAGGRVALTELRPHVLSILRATGFATAFDIPADAGGTAW